jgi:hypothetical protein
MGGKCKIKWNLYPGLLQNVPTIFFFSHYTLWTPENVFLKNSERQCIGYTTFNDGDPGVSSMRHEWKSLSCTETKAPFICKYNPGILAFKKLFIQQ